MNPHEIRKTVIIAMFSDDVLASRLVLKGGSALELVHGIIARGSKDVDLSIPDEFESVMDTRERLFRALRERFDVLDYVVFDERFKAVPPVESEGDPHPWWGGYSLRFRLIKRQRYEEIGSDKDKLHRESVTIDRQQRREFRVEISKHEYCGGALQLNFEGHRIVVYTPEMTAIEKIRAICQQMDAYSVIPKGKKRARARDFYDIYSIITRRAVDLALPENRELCRQIFAAKHVPTGLIRFIPNTREFHRPDWPSVVTSVGDPLGSFDDYFDYVANETSKLESLRDV